MKSYTDLEQSKVLAEILPIESADIFCADVFNKEKETHSYNFHILSTWGCNTFEELKDRENKFVHFIPCWSLAALLSVLPNYIDYDTICRPNLMRARDNNYMVLYSALKHSRIYDNPIDACVELILKLHESNML